MKRLSIHSKMGRNAALAFTLALVAAAPAAAAPVTFAQYFQSDGSDQQWTVSSSGAVTNVTASGSVFILFSGLAGLPFAGPQSSIFSLTASSNEVGNCGVACGPGDSYVQPGYTGTFSFMGTGAYAGMNRFPVPSR